MLKFLDILDSEFEFLRAPSEKVFTETGFHIGPKSRLAESRQLIPTYLQELQVLDPRALFYPDNFDESDYYTTCVIAGNIDQISKFLVKHAAASDFGTKRALSLDDFEQCLFDLHNGWLIVSVDTTRPSLSSTHDSGAVYSEFGEEGIYLPLYKFFSPVDIKEKIEIPVLDFSYTQRLKLLEEGNRFFKQVVQPNPHIFPYDNKGEIVVSELYKFSRMQELAVKSALLKH